MKTILVPTEVAEWSDLGSYYKNAIIYYFFSDEIYDMYQDQNKLWLERNKVKYNIDDIIACNPEFHTEASFDTNNWIAEVSHFGYVCFIEPTEHWREMTDEERKIVVAIGRDDPFIFHVNCDKMRSKILNTVSHYYYGYTDNWGDANVHNYDGSVAFGYFANCDITE